MKNKKWTILIYANGNNELEPEIYTSLTRLIEEEVNDDFNIVIQIGRADKVVVQKLRKECKINNEQCWKGVRRYLIKLNNVELIERVLEDNMAESKTLNDFLVWGLDSYPAEHYLLILSGHGAGFIGMMTDFTHGFPYIMTLQGVINAIYNSCKITKKKIDGLLLDCCYMNTVETWYEFANGLNEYVRYLIVGVDNISIEGILYNILIRYLQESDKVLVENILYDTIKKFDMSNVDINKLLLVNLDKDIFDEFREEIQYTSKMIINNSIDIKKEMQKWLGDEPYNPFFSLIDIYEILKRKTNNESLFNNEEILKKIIVYPNVDELERRLNIGPVIYMPRSIYEINEFEKFYSRLIFNKNNYWLKVIEQTYGKEIKYNNDNSSCETLVPAIRLKNKYVISSILEQNPTLNLEDAILIIKEFGWLE